MTGQLGSVAAVTRTGNKILANDTIRREHAHSAVVVRFNPRRDGGEDHPGGSSRCLSGDAARWYDSD